MKFGDKLNIEPTQIDERLDLQTLNLTYLYYHNLELAFPAAKSAIENLDFTKSTLGTASYFVPHIDEELREGLIQLSEDQVPIPITEGDFGVSLIDQKAQIWLRNCLYTFVGTKLWQEIISKHFNHVLLSSLLVDKSIQQVFIYDVETDYRMRFGLDTDIARYARRVDSLMTRIGIDSGANPYILHSNIADHIKEKHGLAVYNKGEEEAWRELYMKYWMLNEHSLITDSMREFMKGKTLVHIDIDLPTVWNSQELSEYFGDRWWEDRSKQNPLVDLIRKQVLAKYQSYVVAGGRSQSEETMAQAIECILSRTINKYTFFAIVRKDYLERSVA